MIKRTKKQLSTEGKRLRSAKAKDWRASNRDKARVYQSNRNRRLKLKFKAYINAIKEAPCMDCGRSFPSECMDFDHREGEVKVRHIAGWQAGKKGLDAELAKCDLVCACCHRTRTAVRFRAAAAAMRATAQEVLHVV